MPPQTAAPPPTVTDEHRAAMAHWVERNPLRAWRRSHTPPLPIFDAAPIVGVGMSMVGMWEHGVHRPRKPRFAVLAEHLGDDIEQRWDDWLADRPVCPTPARG